MKKAVFLVIPLVASINAVQQANAGELIKGAKIFGVASTDRGKDIFYVQPVGGSGICVNSNILFDIQHSPSPAAYSRTFSLLNTAFVSGKKIDVYSSNDGGVTDCTNGTANLVFIHD